MQPNPPILESGKCVRCGKPRRPERSRRYGGYVAEADPFCSTECARAWHGTSLPVDRRRVANSSITSQAGRRGKCVQHGTRESYRHCACPACVAAVKGQPNPPVGG